MNLILLLYTISTSVLQLCLTQDVPSTYTPDGSQPSPTNDYTNPNGPLDPRNDNTYDPNRRFQNPNSPNQYDVSRSPYDKDQRFNQFDRSDPKYQNPYNPDNRPVRPAWDAAPTYSSSYKAPALESESVIINEA